MKRTIKIKLPFKPEIRQNERKSRLLVWAKSMLKNSNVNILEEKHLDRMSYIVIENTKKKVTK